MRFTSLIVELVRARSSLVFWLVVLAQAMLWFAIPVVFYTSPPGEIPAVLAIGRDYVMGSDLGPPLAFWLADIAFRLAGNHIFGVYLLSQLCFVLTFWALFKLARSIVGPQHAVLAVLLTATITAFSFPGVEFGPDMLAQPLWALVLLNGWRIFGLGRRDAWFALSMNAGLLLLTTHAGLLWLGLFAAFALATKQGRRMLVSLDPLFACTVIVVLVLPYGIFLSRAGAPLPSSIPDIANLQGWPLQWFDLFGRLMLTLAGIALLTLANTSRFGGSPEHAPAIYRPPVGSFARQFVVYFLLAPAVAASLLSALLGYAAIIGGDGVALLMSGLPVVIAGGDLIRIQRPHILRSLWLWIMIAPALLVVATSLVQPWIYASEIRTMLPASAMGEFFGDSYLRRTGQQLRAVAGDPQLAALIAFAAPSRPHLMPDAPRDRASSVAPAAFRDTGGLIVWRAEDTNGAPPADLTRRFPGIVPEVPRAFQRMINGRQPLMRVGWAIVRPSPSR